MPDLQRIRRLGPGPRSFTRRQHQQQKPVGSCLTFKQQLNGSDSEPQLKLEHEPQFGHSAGKPQQQFQQPQLGRPAGKPQQQFQQPQLGHPAGESQQQLQQPQLGHPVGEPQQQLHQPQHQHHHYEPWR